MEELTGLLTLWSFALIISESNWISKLSNSFRIVYVLRIEILYKPNTFYMLTASDIGFTLKYPMIKFFVYLQH